MLQTYSASALSRAIKSPKIYFRDTGLVCYLTRWLTADALKCSAVAGNMFGTFVVSGNPKANMGATNPVLDKIQEKSRGMGVILCLIDKKTYLRENLVALPIEYI